jgi:hypothetical protein
MAATASLWFRRNDCHRLAGSGSRVAREIWLVASVAIVLKSIDTYAYFAPTMIRKFEKAHTIEATELTKSGKR